MTAPRAVIIGAGPAGLTAASELLKHTNVKPAVYEMSSDIGGISRTITYRGNRMDIGGHRFFSKSDRVMNWWKDVLPLQGRPSRDDLILGRNVPLSADRDAPDPERTDRVMLIRNRLSRIFFLRSFFDYPLSLTAETVRNLGLSRIVRIGASYAIGQAFPIREERSLEDFFINRFGRELYATFFRDYTQKVWGVPCSAIKPDWGAQRIKGLSVTKALAHAFRKAISREKSLEQKETETSLIEQFMYPKLGPGHLWEEVAGRVEAKGGEIHKGRRITGVEWSDGRATAVRIRDTETGMTERISCDYVFSTMPIKELIEGMYPPPPRDVREIAAGLLYRDFITVGLLLKRLKISNRTNVPTVNGLVPDNWIYIQERDVKLGRLQIFNNWSPYMVADPETVWLGLEYFCNEGDDLWSRTDGDFVQFAADELARIGIADPSDVIDSTVVRVPRTYPAYFGTYDRFDTIRKFTDHIGNMFLIGRNGMHRYNNADHSMLTAMAAVDSIVAGERSKDSIWAVNAEEEYHERK